MSEFEEYASYIDEEYDQEQQELNQRHCDAEPWYDEDYNNPQENIEKEVAL